MYLFPKSTPPTPLRIILRQFSTHPPQKTIDAHIHLFGPSQTKDFTLDWPKHMAKFYSFPESQIQNIKWSSEKYLREQKAALNYVFSKTLYMEAAYCDDESNQRQNHLNEAKHVQKICENQDWLVGYIAGCDISNGEEYTRKFLDELRDSNGKLSPYLKGLRIV
jgi:predicted TIM-barrel fold metal-dependent hydrolase